MTRNIKQSIIWMIISLFFFLPVAEARNVIIDAGHTYMEPGVISTTGEPELKYNLWFGTVLMWKLNKVGVFSEIVSNLSLKDRVKYFNNSDVDLVISIHHDSTQPQYLGTNKYKGFSLFIYDRKNIHLAERIGKELVSCGYSPSLHHAEDIDGERKTLLSEEYGVYQANFYILKYTRKPIVLLEVGVITNSEEEMKLRKSSVIDGMTNCIVEAVK